MKFVRRVIFWLHLIMGCVAGGVILVMSVTGVLLAYERQINNRINAPVVLPGPTGMSGQASLDSMLAKLGGNGKQTPSALVLHRSTQAPVEAQFGRERTLYLNPWTAEAIGQPSPTARKFFGTVEQIHRSLGMGMRSQAGRGATGACNLIFLFLLISGCYLWFPKFFTAASLKIRLLCQRGLRGKMREWNWHHVVGFWLFVPLLFIVFSGVIMSYPWASNMLYRMTGTQPPAGGMRPGGPAAGGHERWAPGMPQRANAPTFHSLDEIATTVKQQIPGWQSITISVPGQQEPMVNVSVDRSAGGHPEAVTQLTVNRETGNIQSRRGFNDNNTGQKLRTWARFLHTGEEFGVLGETIAALASLGGAFLVWTGIAMTIRRILAAGKKSTDAAEDVRTSEERLTPAS